MPDIFDEVAQETPQRDIFDEAWEEWKSKPVQPLKLDPYQQARMEGTTPIRMGTMGPENPEEITIPQRLLSVPVELAGKAAVKVANIPTAIANRMNEGRTGYPIPGIEELPRPKIPVIPGRDVTSGLVNAVTGTINEMVPPLAPPEVGLTLPLAGAGRTAGKIAAGGFGASAAAGLPELAIQTAGVLGDRTATPADKAQAVGNLAIQGGFTAGMLKAAASRPKPQFQGPLATGEVLRRPEGAKPKPVVEPAKPTPEQATGFTPEELTEAAQGEVAPTVAENAPNPERVVAAAIKMPNGEIRTGTAHPLIPGFTESSESQMGFVTNLGRYVSREEANQISGQEALKSKKFQEGLGKFVYPEDQPKVAGTHAGDYEWGPSKPAKATAAEAAKPPPSEPGKAEAITPPPEAVSGEEGTTPGTVSAAPGTASTEAAKPEATAAISQAKPEAGVLQEPSVFGGGEIMGQSEWIDAFGEKPKESFGAGIRLRPGTSIPIDPKRSQAIRNRKIGQINERNERAWRGYVRKELEAGKPIRNEWLRAWATLEGDASAELLRKYGYDTTTKPWTGPDDPNAVLRPTPATDYPDLSRPSPPQPRKGGETGQGAAGVESSMAVSVPAQTAVELSSLRKADVKSDPRLSMPGITKKSKPNSLIVALRDLESMPVKEVVLKSSGDPMTDAKKVEATIRKYSGQQNNISLRESLAVTTGPNGRAILKFGISPNGMTWASAKEWLDLVESRKPQPATPVVEQPLTTAPGAKVEPLSESQMAYPNGTTRYRWFNHPEQGWMVIDTKFAGENYPAKNKAEAVKSARQLNQAVGPDPHRLETAPLVPEGPGAMTPGEQKPPEIVGMGGAVPSEYGAGTATSNKNATVDSERASRGEEPMMAPLRRTWGEVWDRAMGEVDKDPAIADRLIAELVENPRALQDWENAVLLHRRVDLRNEYAKATRDAAAAYEDSKAYPDRIEGFREAQARVQFFSDKLLELEKATGKGGAGTETGRALAARKMMANDDFTLASLEMQKRADNGFRPLTDAERTELKRIADEHKRLSDELQVKLDAANKKVEEIEAQRILAQAQADAAKQAASPYSPQVFKIAEQIVASWDKAADAARTRLKEKFARTSAGVDPTIVYDLAVVGRSHLGHAALDFAKWSVKMVGEFGEGVGPYLQAAFDKANELIAKERTAAPDPKRKAMDVVNKTPEQVAAEFVDGVKKKVAEKRARKQNADISWHAKRLAAFFVERGTRDRNVLITQVHDVLKQAIPELTRRETTDILCGYGDYKPLDMEPIKVILRDLYGQMQQQRKIEDMTEGRAGKRSGFPRRTPSDEERRLIKQVEEKKRQGGYSVTDPERQLRTALQAIQTRLENQITDLTHQIQTRTKIVKEKHTVVLDAKTRELMARRDVLKKQYDEIFNPPMTDAQRLAAWKERTQEKIRDYTSRIKAGDFRPKPKPDPIRFDNEALHLRFQLNQIHRAWLEGRIKDHLAQQTALQKGIRYTGEALNTTRALLTSFDLSAVLRQGGFIGFAHPLRSLQSFPAMFKALLSEKGQFAVMEEIRTRPNAPMYDQAKLYLAEHGARLSQMEEVYMSRLAEKIPGIRASQRAYTTFLNKLRADSFDAMARTLSADGNITLPEAKVIANFINVATGRGSVGLNQAGVALNTVFFAPRYVASRFQLLAGQPLWGTGGFKGTGKARTAVAAEYARFLAGAAVVYTLGMAAGASVETDPKSSDFGKLRIGDTRIDLLSGLSQAAVLEERLRQGKIKTAAGKTYPIRGKVPYGKSDASDVMWRFLRSKLAPAIGTAIDVATGKDVVGRPVTAATLPERLVVPITYQDIFDAMKAQGVPAGTALGILSIFGASIQNYKANAKFQ